MYLLCGLGNKGTQYSFTRHNAGYLVIDRYAEKYNLPFTRKIKGCRVAISDAVMLVKPDTFMNLSGGPLASLMHHYKIEPEKLIVIQDELDMELGRMRIRWNGRDGGHRGVRSVIDAIQTSYFHRLKVGIGRDPVMAPEEYVLSRFRQDELEELTDVIARAVESLHMFVHDSKEKAMSIYNRA